jgi:Fe-S-cluster containining protein
LRIDPEIFMQRFSPGCSMCSCNGTCCSEGVLLDLKEKEIVLDHADLIQRYLEPQQENDPAKWFDNMIERDLDFPSGQCDGTAVWGGSCVFLDSKGLCTLQKVSIAEGMHKFQLKPFYCIAFPLTIEGHVLTTHEPEFTNRTQCCSSTPVGSLTVLDVCREEFEYILGADGLKEIEQLFHEETAPSTVSVI